MTEFETGLAALHSALSRLDALGSSLIDEPFPHHSSAAAESFEHLIDQVVCWMGWEVLHADPLRPAFQRHNDLVTQWGGPNADNVYRHARLDPAYRYRIHGRMHSCDDFLLALRAGFMHNETWGTRKLIAASSLDIGPGDEFEILLGGDATGTIAIPGGTIMASIREYYFGWRPDEPATFTIECLDDIDSAQPPLVERVGLRIDDAVGQIADSLAYWNNYLADNRAAATDNSFNDPMAVAKGLSVARYRFCFWDLDPDQALVIESTAPEARYYSLQLYRMGTFELVDPFGRVTSRNHTQTRASSDGKLRWVLAGSDPGIANWLDTAGRKNGLCTLRWFWPDDPDAAPELSARVVDFDQLDDELPPDTARMAPDSRRTELRQRQEHLRWRFRT